MRSGRVRAFWLGRSKEKGVTVLIFGLEKEMELLALKLQIIRAFAKENQNWDVDRMFSQEGRNYRASCLISSLVKALSNTAKPPI